MNEMHTEFYLEFEEYPVVHRYSIVIALQLQVSSVISSAAFWPSSFPCRSVTFIWIITNPTGRVIH